MPRRLAVDLVALVALLGAPLVAAPLACAPAGAADAGPDDDDDDDDPQPNDCSWDALVQSGSILTPQDYALPADCTGPAATPAAGGLVIASDEATFVDGFGCTAVDADLNFFTRHVAAIAKTEFETLDVVVDVDGAVTFALSDPGGCRGIAPAYAWTYVTFTSGPYTAHRTDVCVVEPCTCGADGDPCPP